MTRTTANNLSAGLAIAGLLAYLEEIEERADACTCDVGYSGGCGCSARIGNLIGGDLDDVSTCVLGEWVNRYTRRARSAERRVG